MATKVGVAQGGTNIGSYTVGDLLYASATGVLSKLAVGANGKFLKVVSGVPAWATAPGSLPDVFNVLDYGAVGDGTTDDTAGIQAAINACAAAGGGIVYFPFVLNGYSIQGALDATANSQIVIPTQTDGAHEISILLRGGLPPNLLNLTGRNIQGPVLKSTIAGSGTTPAVFGTTPFTFGFNTIQVYMENLIIRTETISGGTDIAGTMCGINFGHLSTFAFNNIKIDVTSAPANIVQPTNETYGIILPLVNNNARITGGLIFVEGYKYCIQVSEHTHIREFLGINSVNGIKLVEAAHSIVFENVSIEACNNNIVLNQTGTYTTGSLTILNYSAEHAVSGWQTQAYDIVQTAGSAKVYIFTSRVVVAGSGPGGSFLTSGSPSYLIYNGDGKNNGIGVPVASGTAKSILYIDASNKLAQDNSHFTYDYTNVRVGIGLTSPSVDFHVQKSVGSDGAVQGRIENTNTGGEGVFDVKSSVGSLTLESWGSTFSNTALRSSGGVSTDASLTNGLWISALADAPIYFSTNGRANNQMKLTGGNLFLGTTTGSGRLNIDGGSILFTTDNSYNIGAVGATRPSNGYFGTLVTAPTITAATKFLTADGTAGAPSIAFSSAPTTAGLYYGGSQINFVTSVADASLTIRNNNSGGFPGIAYVDNSGAVKTFTGYENTGGNFRFNHLGSGDIVFKISSTDYFKVKQNGGIAVAGTNTASGTTGAQTINKSSGSVNFAAGASTLVVTNSLATATSVVIVTVYGTDATATSARVTRASGSFTITLNAAATAETAVGFFVINNF